MFMDPADILGRHAHVEARYHTVMITDTASNNMLTFNVRILLISKAI